MILRSLSLIDFKNIQEADLVFSEGVNCMVGKNGAGKTNLLDAIHYLAFCKSASNPVDGQNIREGRPFFVVQGTFEEGSESYELTCSMERNKKKRFRKERREYDRLADHIGRFPAVLIAPFDLGLVQEGSEKRRRFLDGIISQYQHSYLQDLLRYNRALSHRNALLKRAQRGEERPEEELELWEERMSDRGERIREARKAFLAAFIPIFRSFHERIAGEEQVSLEYIPSGEGELREEFRQHREKDLVLGYSSTGPHREDLRFRIRGSALKKFGSQGQQKSYVLALKLAQYAFIRDALNTHPVLLLDDLFDKLDQERMKALLELVTGEGFEQVFVTDTDQGRLEEALEGVEKECRFFSVQEGKVIPWNMETTNAL
ncbi:MAG: DNA replication/repair protein RecF [Flavobacteriales bacterium]